MKLTEVIEGKSQPEFHLVEAESEARGQERREV